MNTTIVVPYVSRTMMLRMTLRELREIIAEAIDVDRMLARSSVGKAYISRREGSGVEFTSLSPSGEPTGYAQLSPSRGWRRAWNLDALYADDPGTGLFLMATALFELGRVVPDESVSPAAQAVLKRYWDQYSDDVSRIVQPTEDDPDVDERDSWWREQPWLFATYLPVPGFDPTDAKRRGEALVDPSARHATTAKGREGFWSTYSDPVKTGHMRSLDDILKQDPQDAARTVRRMHGAGGKTTASFEAWLRSNRDRLKAHLARDPDTRDILGPVSL